MKNMTMRKTIKTTARVRVKVAYGPAPSIIGNLMKLEGYISSKFIEKECGMSVKRTLSFHFF